MNHASGRALEVCPSSAEGDASLSRLDDKEKGGSGRARSPCALEVFAPQCGDFFSSFFIEPWGLSLAAPWPIMPPMWLIIFSCSAFSLAR